VSVRTASPSLYHKHDSPLTFDAVLGVQERPARWIPLENKRAQKAPEHCGGVTSRTADTAGRPERVREKYNENDCTIQQRAELLGNAAHDLRLPAAAILTCSELLAEGHRTPEQNELIELIHSASRFMLQLLDDTLDVATLQSGAVQLRTSPGILATIVQQCVSTNAPLAQRKHIRLTLSQDGKPLPVRLDPVKMMKVFNNLIDNAIKYCQSGARVDVHVSRGEDSVLVSVRDSGPGIDAATLKSLFTPFHHTRARTMSETPSTGLGLAIAKQIVELHQGRIWVKSDPGKGTTFYVSLPTQLTGLSKKS
jgi:signal transduction histidine kinase